MNPLFDPFEWNLTRKSLVALNVFFMAVWAAAIVVQALPGQLRYAEEEAIYALRGAGFSSALAFFIWSRRLREGSPALTSLALAAVAVFFGTSIAIIAISRSDPVVGQGVMLLTGTLFILQIGFFTRHQTFTLAAGGTMVAASILLFQVFRARLFPAAMPPSGNADSMQQILLFAFPMVTIFVAINNSVANTLTRRARESAEAMRKLAFYDQETGLPNARSLEGSLGGWKPRPAGKEIFIAFRLTGLDRLGEARGLVHAVGAVKRISAAFAEALAGDFLARLGTESPEGLEPLYRLDHWTFALVLSAPPGAAPLIPETEKALADLLHRENELENGGQPLGFVGAFTVFPDDAQAPGQLLRNVLNVLYGTGTPGRLVPFNQSAYREYLRREELKNALGPALDSPEFYALFQPKIRISDGRVAGFEALARWNSPSLGMVPPTEFIPVAEEFGYVERLTLKMISAALELQNELEQSGFEEVRTSVNLPPSLLNPSFLARLGSGLCERGACRSLEFEITEGNLMVIDETTATTLGALRKQEITFSIDDFGTGYSNLGYLQTFHADALKIDRKFIQGIPLDQKNAALVRAIIQIARAFGMEVVAEGVEYREQADYLREAGCDQIQGFLYAKPLGPAEAVAFVLRAFRG